MDRSRALGLLGVALVVLGVAVLVWALVTGEAEIALVVIVPVIYGSGPLAALAILMVFAGFALLFFSFASRVTEEPSRPEAAAEARPSEDRRFGGVVLIGPIPIVFGSAKALKGTWALVALAALGALILVLFLLLTVRP